jgi:hypothetical protein
MYTYKYFTRVVIKHELDIIRDIKYLATQQYRLISSYL